MNCQKGGKKVMNLYNNEEIKIMDNADMARIADGSRIEEIKNFAKLQGIKKSVLPIV
jgi:hypothetical protein